MEKEDRHIIALGVFIAIVISALAITAARSQPVLKGKAQCPSGWSQSGAYCNPPSGDRKVCIRKEGQCPSGMHQSGGFCCN